MLKQNLPKINNSNTYIVKMTLYNKHISILITILIFISLKINAQEVNVIDKKGTIQTVKNTRVFTGAANKPANADAVIGDIYFDQYPNPNSVEIWDGTLWKVIKNNTTHTGTSGSVFFADIFGNPTENNSQFFWDNANERLYIGNPLLGTNKLNVNGTIRTSGLNNADGTVGLPSYRFYDDSDTGMYRITDNQLGFSTAGTNALSIDASQNISIPQNLSVTGTYTDSSGDVGTNGQILSSTATGTDWINNNTVTTNNTGTGPTPANEGDIWFDTLNSEIKIYDIVDGWKLITSTNSSNNIYTTNGTLTTDRTVNGAANSLVFNNLNTFTIQTIGGAIAPDYGLIDITSAGATEITSAGANAFSSGGATQINSTGITQINAIGGLSVNGNTTINNSIELNNTLLDVNNLPGTAGQVLTSTSTSVEWANNAALTPGDIKHGIQTANHGGWYLLDGTSIASLPANAQTNAAALGLAGNLPDATDKVLKNTNGVQAMGLTIGTATTTLNANNIPELTGNTTSTGDHDHTVPGTARAANSIVFSGFNTYDINNGTTSTTGTGSHNHNVTVNSGGVVTPISLYQPSLVVNTFIYLGL